MYAEICNYEPLWGSWKVEELLGSGNIGKVYKFTIPKSAVTNKVYASFGIKSAPGIVYFDDLSIGQLP